MKQDQVLHENLLQDGVLPSFKQLPMFTLRMWAHVLKLEIFSSDRRERSLQLYPASCILHAQDAKMQGSSFAFSPQLTLWAAACFVVLLFLLLLFFPGFLLQRKA